ncbi:hypothetical protein QNH99_08610 [Pantoea allii]|uniref:Uncharacterized protein n=1 Tax=Pantoea allii TaxID=574096 RepID=A0A2V2BGT4_9GAMM|nr:hypothetical protein [Pantoea allii]MDJ0036524.1 hypothetical protein [Pantoea allii]MDJ0038599.1 hypothetical protein [Pantoea allii]NQS87853.1 hypothetical protein [Pantoea allii]PWK96767.1 hypothetical protein C7431_10596 [Pantoea allii]
MAFPKVNLIEGLTTDPGSNPAGSANFLTKEVLEEALILVRSFEPKEIAQLSKTETSQIAYAMSNYKDENNRRFKSWNEESASHRKPGGEIRRLDNRIAGVKVQQASMIVTGAVASSTGATGMALWSALNGLGSIIGRGSLPVIASIASSVGGYFVTKRTFAVNQMAAHIKTLADTFNSTHEAFEEFKVEAERKRANFKPDTEMRIPLSFEQTVASHNAMTPDQAQDMATILQQFIHNEYKRVELYGTSNPFVKVFFRNQSPLSLSRTQYSTLINLKFP